MMVEAGGNDRNQTSDISYGFDGKNIATGLREV